MRLLRRRRTAEPVRLDPADPRLVLLVEARDPAQSDSEVLAGLDLSRPVLVRHCLTGLTEDAVSRAAEVLAEEGYAVVPGGEGEVLAVRTQLLTGLSASQERSRMAGLAQRLGGDVRGWDALHLPAP